MKEIDDLLGSNRLIGDVCYPVEISLGQRSMAPEISTLPALVHLYFFLSLHDIKEFSLVSSHINRATGGTYVLFSKLEDKDTYLRWLYAYSMRFGTEKMENSLFPGLPLQGEHKFVFVGHSFKDTDQESTRVLLWKWIYENCKFGVYRFNGGYAFENEQDAMLFKMTHT